MRYFKDRVDAGIQLAATLEIIPDKGADIVVIGLPRGGVVVAAEISKKHGWPLDIVVPRKISVPEHEEYAIGAITEDGTFFPDKETIAYLGISKNYLEKAIEEQKKEAQRRLKMYRGTREPMNLKNKTVIVIDDGIATGYTLKAALFTIKSHKPASIILAVPVAPQAALQDLQHEVDQIVCLHTPHPFGAVGQFYEVFDQTEDEEVIALMEQSEKQRKKFLFEV